MSLLVVGPSACNMEQLMLLRQRDASLIWKHMSCSVQEACQAWLLLSCICAVSGYAQHLVQADFLVCCQQEQEVAVT